MLNSSGGGHVTLPRLNCEPWILATWMALPLAVVSTAQATTVDQFRCQRALARYLTVQPLRVNHLEALRPCAGA